MGLTPHAWWVVAAYAGTLVALGVFAFRRHTGAEDYFLASRRTHWPTIGLSIFAANISSTALVGLTGGAYAVGLAVFDYEWSATVTLVIFSLYFLPSIIRSGIYTMPEYLERRYDAGARLLFALLTLFLNLAADATGVLYSGSMVCHLVFPACPLAILVFALAGAAGLYTIAGGLRSVMYTQTVQAVVLVVSALLISVTAFRHAGGWQHVTHTVPPEALSLIRPATDPYLPWPGLLLGVPILSFYYWCTNQNIVQCVLAARDLQQARRGVLFAGLLKLSVLFLVVLPGVCALLLYPHLERADLVYAHLILQLLPDWLLGLVVAAFVAATIVAMASLLNSASTLISMDVVRHFLPGIRLEHSVLIGRISTAFLMVCAVAWAPQLIRFPSLWQYLQAVLAYVVPPIVVLFLAGKFWARANARAARTTLWLGSACGLLLFLVNGVWQITHLHFLYAAPLLTAIDALIFVSVCLRHPAVLSEQQKTAMASGAEPPGTLVGGPAILLDHRVQAAVLLALTTALVIEFR